MRVTCYDFDIRPYSSLQVFLSSRHGLDSQAFPVAMCLPPHTSIKISIRSCNQRKSLRPRHKDRSRVDTYTAEWISIRNSNVCRDVLAEFPISPLLRSEQRHSLMSSPEITLIVGHDFSRLGWIQERIKICLITAHSEFRPITFTSHQ